LIEEIVGDGVGGPVVLVECAVVAIGPALGDQVDLSAGGAACLGGPVGGGDAKLLGGVEGRAQDAGEGIAVDLVVVVQSIKGNVALVRAPAGNGSLAAVGVLTWPMYRVPGWRLSREIGLRPSIGSASMVVVPTELPMVASVRLRISVAELTSTVTVSAFTLRVKSMVAGWSTSNSAVRDCVAKPLEVMVTR
jgi:hypothetical protein